MKCISSFQNGPHMWEGRGSTGKRGIENWGSSLPFSWHLHEEYLFLRSSIISETVACLRTALWLLPSLIVLKSVITGGPLHFAQDCPVLTARNLHPGANLSPEQITGCSFSFLALLSVLGCTKTRYFCCPNVTHIDTLKTHSSCSASRHSLRMLIIHPICQESANAVEGRSSQFLQTYYYKWVSLLPSWRAGEVWALCFQFTFHFLSFYRKEKLQLTKLLGIQHPLVQSSHSGRGHLFQRRWTGSVLPFSCLLGIHKGLGCFSASGQPAPSRQEED